MIPQSMTLIQDYLSFIKYSPTPFHVVQNSKKILLSKGFKKIRMEDVSLAPGKYFLECYKTMLIAFCVPKDTSKSESCLDCIKLRENDNKIKKSPDCVCSKSDLVGNLFLKQNSPITKKLDALKLNNHSQNIQVESKVENLCSNANLEWKCEAENFPNVQNIHSTTQNTTYISNKSIMNGKTTRLPLRLVATHCDSPVLKINPSFTSGYYKLVPYGGGIWHTWFDRPLGVAGAIYYACGCMCLLDIRKPIFCIPSLAIHISDGIYKNGFSYNKDDHLKALYSTDPTLDLKELLKNNTNDNCRFQLCKKHRESLVNEKILEISESINTTKFSKTSHINQVNVLDEQKSESQYSNKEEEHCNISQNKKTYYSSCHEKPSGYMLRKDIALDSDSKEYQKKNRNQNEKAHDWSFIQSSSTHPENSNGSETYDFATALNKKENTEIDIQNHDYNIGLGNSIDENIVSHDLSLYSLQDPILGGAKNELIFASRQDNLLSTFTALISLRQSQDITAVAIFDHEEIGSETETGALSFMIKKFVKKLKIDSESSILASADVTHALHENYSSHYDTKNSPQLGKGMTIKFGTRYATKGSTAQFAYKCGAHQTFCNKNTIPGGSTVGPMLCAGLGIQGFDVGAPILAMHSVVETSHVDDLHACEQFFKNFFTYEMN